LEACHRLAPNEEQRENKLQKGEIKDLEEKDIELKE
jgi:hypothetical protein